MQNIVLVLKFAHSLLGSRWRTGLRMAVLYFRLGKGGVGLASTLAGWKVILSPTQPRGGVVLPSRLPGGLGIVDSRLRDGVPGSLLSALMPKTPGLGKD